MKTRFIFPSACILLFTLASEIATAQWYVIPDLQYANIECLTVANDTLVFVGGQQGLLLRSTDSGQHWQNIWGGSLSDTILALGTAGGYIFAGTFGLYSVHRSTDNGTTWAISNTGLPGTMQAHAFTATDTKLFVAGDYGVYSSTDWGESWAADTTGLDINPQFPGDHSSTTVGITSVNGQLYTIRQNWEGVFTSRADTVVWSSIGLSTNSGFSIVSIDTNVFAGTQSGIFLYGGDGSTWIPRNDSLPGLFSDCILATVDSFLIAYILGDGASGVYVTSDLGQNWKKVDITDFSSSFVRSMIATKHDVIVGTDFGGWRKPMAEILTSVESETIGLPEKFSLSQNYPNPFNGIANFGLSILEQADVELKVYDMLGREVATLLNERKVPGIYTVQWDSGNAPSGVYFYRLRAGGNVETKKMGLVK